MWLAVSSAAFLAACRRSATLLILSPAALLALGTGQSALLASAALLAGLAWARPRPALAGLCFALLTMKPQYAWLVPVVLAAARAWPALGWTCVATAALVGASVLAFGPGLWVDQLGEGGPMLNARGMIGGSGPWIDGAGSVLVAASRAGAGPGVASAAQAACAIAGAGLAWAAVRRHGLNVATTALALFATFLGAPYFGVYDLVALTPALAWLGSRGGAWTAGVVAGLWTAPGLVFALSATLGGPSPVPALLAGALWCAWRRL